MKIHHLYKQKTVLQSLIPKKRSPKFKIKRFDLQIEKEIVSLRELGNNRYETHEILKTKHLQFSCATMIYNTFKKYGLNKLNIIAKEEKKKSL